MGYVPGELGKKIEMLMDDSDKLFNEGKYGEAIAALAAAWELLPDDKNQWDESFLIVWGVLDTAIKAGDKEAMRQWVDRVFYADPGRMDTGERPMWAGKIAFELGEPDKAFMYFDEANKKSRGRCFRDEDCKYFAYYMENKVQ